jgi:CO/xanthine dehydrogenase FAD-binding subunit
MTIIRPRNLHDTLLAISDGAIPLAGGTDLLVRIRRHIVSSTRLVDLSGLADLKGIVDVGEDLALGCLVTHGQVVSSEVLKKHLPLLAMGCSVVGSPQVRNMGTLGGNIVNASPAADSVPPLVALGARVLIRSLAGEREMELEDLISGPGRTQLRQDELVTSIIVRKMRPGERYLYRKLGQRKALAISIASLAIRFRFDLNDQRCTDPGIAFGSVSPVIRRARGLEEMLLQRPLDQDAIRNIANRARECCNPVTDLRASADYRREMCGALLAGALEKLTQEVSKVQFAQDLLSP